MHICVHAPWLDPGTGHPHIANRRQELSLTLESSVSLAAVDAVGVSAMEERVFKKRDPHHCEYRGHHEEKHHRVENWFG